MEAQRVVLQPHSTMAPASIPSSGYCPCKVSHVPPPGLPPTFSKHNTRWYWPRYIALLCEHASNTFRMYSHLTPRASEKVLKVHFFIAICPFLISGVCSLAKCLSMHGPITLFKKKNNHLLVSALPKYILKTSVRCTVHSAVPTYKGTKPTLR